MKNHDSPYEDKTKNWNLRYLEELRPLSKINRHNQTLAEKVIWNQILGKDKTGFRFLRQKSIDRFIIDFYCSKLLLAIEIDGEYHNDRLNRDEGRDKYLINLGIVTIRY